MSQEYNYSQRRANKLTKVNSLTEWLENADEEFHMPLNIDFEGHKYNP